MADVPENSRIDSVLDDPGTVAIARVYSEAFLDAAGDKAAEGIEEFTSLLEDVLAANPQFESMLITGLSNRDEKIGFIDRAIAPHSSEFFANYLRVLAQHDRLDLLKEILASARLEFEKRNGQQRVQVVSAKPPPLLTRQLWHGSKSELQQRLVLNQLLNLRRIRASSVAS